MPCEYLAMLVGLLYWGVFGVSLTVVAGILEWVLPAKMGTRVGRYLIHFIFRHFVTYLDVTKLVHADLSSLDELGKLDQPFIIAPNHASLWDAVFILARLPQAVCVMKKSILKNPLLGGGARLARHIPNDSLTRMIRNASSALKQGSQLLLFPEGTRTAPDARWINSLKGGCAIIASRSGVPVYPVFIRSNSRFMQKGSSMLRRPIYPILMDFQVGAPMHFGLGETPQEFTARLQALYEQELSKPHPLRRTMENSQG